MAKQRAPASWTCARCEVTVRWASGERTRKPPENWVKRGKRVYCLACQRDLVGEKALEGAPEGATNDQLRKLDVAARVEFEIKRDPEVPDGQIAKACRTSVASVRSTRERLGLAGSSG